MKKALKWLARNIEIYINKYAISQIKHNIGNLKLKFEKFKEINETRWGLAVRNPKLVYSIKYGV